MSVPRLLIWPLIALGLAGSILFPLQVHAQELLIIEGQVVNGTPNGGTVSGLTVVLHEEGLGVHNHLEALTDDEGRFRFGGVDFDPTIAYGVSAWFEGALYGVDLDVSFGPVGSVLLEIFDAVDNEEVMLVSSASLLFADVNESTHMISVLEIVTISNLSDRTYVPGPEPMAFLRFGLPSNYRGLQVEVLLPGADFIEVDKGFALLASVPPGEHELMYTYEFPYLGTQADFTRNLNYGAAHLRVLAPQDVLTLSSEQLGSPKIITIGEALYQLIEGRDMPRGQRISVRLEGLTGALQPQPNTNYLGSIRLEYVAPVALGLFMVSVIGYPFLRRFRRGEARELGADLSTGGEERQAIRQMIADLEESFTAGDLSLGEYRRRRDALHAALASLARGR